MMYIMMDKKHIENAPMLEKPQGGLEIVKRVTLVMPQILQHFSSSVVDFSPVFQLFPSYFLFFWQKDPHLDLQNDTTSLLLYHPYSFYRCIQLYTHKNVKCILYALMKT